ncbi:MAG TPA: peptide ABC transporter substrate-binding protein [Candidatus Limnocylindrales bacterium]|nr:peptide ABC transporter substrate-binding protein [Candidatus Limnocylindrales bacterium]
MISKRFLTSVAAAAIVFGACGSTGSPSPSATESAAASTPASSPSESAGTSASPTASQSAVDQALFGSTYKPETGTPGNTIVVGEWEAPDTLNPFTTTAFATFEAISPIMRGFLTIDSDGKYIPDLAASIPTQENGGVVANPDGKTFDVKVTLKPNLKWSDGQPLTMNDFKFTVTYAQQKIEGCSSCAIGFPDISSVDVSSDGLTGTIHFKDLYAGWLAFLTTSILPQHYFQNVAAADFPKSMPVDSTATKIPWSGPFMVSAASKSEIDYVPNPNWAGGVGGPHAPYLAGLKFKFYGTKDGMIADFLSGNLDLALDMTQADYPAIQKVAPTVGTAELTPAWQYEHVDLNNDPDHKRGNGLWDPNVRKAIAMAINKDDLTAKVFPGQTISPQACSPVPPGLWFRDETVQCPAYDPAGAMQLIQAFGMTGGTAACDTKTGTNCWQYNGKPVNLELATTSGNPTRLTELQLIQGYLAKVGFQSYIKTGDAGSVFFAGWADTKPDTDPSLYRGNYDIGDFAYIEGADLYSNFYYTYNSAQWPENGDHQGANDTRFKSQALDDATNQLKSEIDLSKQLDAAKTIQQAWVEGTPEVALYYRNEATGVGVHLGNWPKYAPSSVGPLWDVEDWYFKP